ncbi:hypothetical protein M501DRAFT_105427 [Patellaria atrata CBS 101060]|uniref:Uncharacterized protein n=1 Tax=Patellaria atrata CBS 101060 TaxID=1346257 RepID=A0A9P4VS49_9PEZI|nr:hypothetical protein M501DRAFT_105427 [Patellaria atrata CBS 101060]
MCVAELNASTMPCGHRWYHLLRPCSPSTNLSNCPTKLGLEGWEIKCDFCPFCSGYNLSDNEYRLVGNERRPSVGGLSRSPSISLMTARRDSRRGSIARSDSGSSITMITGEKNRSMNTRLDTYLSCMPERVLSTDTKVATAEEDEEPPSPTESNSTGGGRFNRTPSPEKPGVFSKGWKKSKRFSRNIFSMK